MYYIINRLSPPSAEPSFRHQVADQLDLAHDERHALIVRRREIRIRMTRKDLLAVGTLAVDFQLHRMHPVRTVIDRELRQPVVDAV